jgi:hypothetical protein
VKTTVDLERDRVDFCAVMIGCENGREAKLADSASFSRDQYCDVDIALSRVGHNIIKMLSCCKS